MFAQLPKYSMRLTRMMWVLLAISALVACKTTESTGLRDYSNGIDVAVQADAKNPAYSITEAVGVAGYGYAYMLEKANGRWRVMYDSFDAKAFAKPAGDVKEIPADTEVLWTDGKKVAVYFGTAGLVFSKVDGSFACPKDKNVISHRACRSLLTEAKSIFDGLNANKDNRPFVLNINEIKQAVADTGIVATAKRRMAGEK